MRVAVTYPSGHKITYNYDLGGRVSSVTYQNGSSINTVANNMEYRPYGPLKSMDFGNGAVRTISHDLDYRPTRVYTSGIQDLNYQFDNSNNISKITNNKATSLTQSFGYDSENRLNSITSASGNHTYTYDQVGNRKGHNTNGLAETYSYAINSNRLTNVANKTTSQNVSYNGNGQTTAKNGASYSYNGNNRLSSHTKSSQTTNFTYNALGQRVKKTGSSGNTHYLYNENGQLIAEHSTAGVVQKEYVYLNGQVVGLIKANTLYYVHNDHLGRAERITNQSKSTVWSASNYAFDRAVNTNTIGDYNLGFPGQYFDKEMGTYYNYFRDYDPAIGRYLQSDPIGLAGGINTYGYATQNPLIAVDEYGLFSLGGCVVQGFFGGVAGYSARESVESYQQKEKERQNAAEEDDCSMGKSNPDLVTGAAKVKDTIGDSSKILSRSVARLALYGAGLYTFRVAPCPVTGAVTGYFWDEIFGE